MTRSRLESTVATSNLESSQGETERNDRAAAVVSVASRYGPAELADDVDHEEQPQAPAQPSFGRLIRLSEVFQHLRRESRSGVAHTEHEGIAASLGGEADPV